MRLNRIGAWLLVGVAVLSAAQAQERRGYSSLLDNSEFLIDSYSSFLVRKYNLTPEQTEFTKTLIKQKAQTFLSNHNDSLRGLVDQLFDVRTGAEMSPDELVTWGKQVMPLYEEAKKLVISGNDDWRQILNDEQKLIHDQDLVLMNNSFQMTERQLGRIVSGEMTVDEFRFPQNPAKRAAPAPAPPQVVQMPPRPAPGEVDAELAQKLAQDQQQQVIDVQAQEEAKLNEAVKQAEEAGLDPSHVQQPVGGPPITPGKSIDQVKPEAAEEAKEVSQPPPPQPQPMPAVPAPHAVQPAPPSGPAKAPRPHEGEWDTYVRQFIERYKLDAQQAQKAHSILDDCKSAAEKVTRGNQGAIERLDQRKAELTNSTSPTKAADLAKIEEERKKLLEPISRIFDGQLKPRLERLPTRAQRKLGDAAPKPAGAARPDPKATGAAAKPADKANSKAEKTEKP